MLRLFINEKGLLAHKDIDPTVWGGIISRKLYFYVLDLFLTYPTHDPIKGSSIDID